MQDHNQRQHALLSCSGSDRWMNCTPSARMEDTYGEEQEQSFYAHEGELAHELGELYIRRDILEDITTAQFEEKFSEIINDDAFNDDMIEEVDKYVQYVEDQFNEAKTRNHDAVLIVEQKLNLTRFIPDGFGTSDANIISDQILDVIDLKFGRGVQVEAENNSQLKLYGLGALEHFSMAFDIKKIRLTIVQPRRNHVSFTEIDVDELYEWAHTELKEKAKMAFNGEGEMVPGDWCRFCRIKPKCKALAKKNLELAKFEFADSRLLSDDEISEIIEKSSQLTEWANAVNKYALDKALKGKQWPGYKIVSGMSRRKFVDDDSVAKVLLQELQYSQDDIYNTKLKGITDIEKLLGKKMFREKLEDEKLVVKPQGKPTLVPMSDKRAALGDEQAKLDFK